jgi:hypothetical protein
MDPDALIAAARKRGLTPAVGPAAKLPDPGPPSAGESEAAFTRRVIALIKENPWR